MKQNLLFSPRLAFLYLFIALWQNTQLFAQSIPKNEEIIHINDQSTLKLLGEKIYFIEDAKSEYTIEDILKLDKQARFVKFGKPVFVQVTSDKSYWLKILVRDESSAEQYLELEGEFLKTIDFYLDGVLLNQTGWSRPEKSRPYPIRYRYWFLLKKKPEIQKIYLKVYNNGAMEAPIQIGTLTQLHTNKTSYDYVFGGFVGIVLMMICYNLFLFIAVKDRTYILYILSLMITIIYLPFLNGYTYITYLLGEDYRRYWVDYFFVWGAFYHVLVNLFVIDFLKLKKYAPFAFYLLAICIGIYGFLHPMMNIFQLIPYYINLTLYQVISMVVAFIMVGSGLYVWLIKKQKQAIFFTVANIWYVVGAVLFISALNGGIPYNFFTRNAMLLGTVLEILFFALALGDRIRRINQETRKIEAHNLELIVIQNQNLENKVAERTLQLQENNDKLLSTNEELKSTIELVEQERQKSDTLLLNILPEETAQELKTTGTAKPKHYDLVSVLFTDFKGFSQIAEKLSPQEVIENLNTCFLALDGICERHHLEKIKTIGDSYMCAGGIPVANHTNPIDCVQAGLEMQAWMANWKAEKQKKGELAWELRLGIHSGAVVAGVIGKNKFAYDIWGDTVNLASRMESSGEAGKVNISGTTYELVKDKFQCTYRGKIEAKNKGEVEMYFVESVL